MLEWLQRLLRQSKEKELLETIDSLNKSSGGGSPTEVEMDLAWLPLQSDSLVLGEPMHGPAVTVTDIDVDKVDIAATALKYPRGQVEFVELRLSFGDAFTAECSKIGSIAVDSAKLFVADKAAYEAHWTKVGPDRIGVIRAPRDEEVLRLLTKQFRLKTTQVNAVRHEIAGPVSKELEAEMIAYLKSIPKYAKYPFMHFDVQTNNSFDRVNFMEMAWDVMPIGNEPSPPMFACVTGSGDGNYDVLASYSEKKPKLVKIDFRRRLDER